MIEEGNVSQKSNNKGILSPSELGFKVQSCEVGKIKDSSIGIFENLFFAFSSLMAFHSGRPGLRRVSIHNVQNCHETFSREKNPLAILRQSVRQSDFYAGFLNSIVDRFLDYHKIL